MKIRKLLSLALCLLICLSVSFGLAEAKVYEQPEITLVISDINPEDSPLGMTNFKFAEMLKEATNGRIQADIYCGGQLGTEADNVNNLRLGVVAMTRVNTGNLAARGIDIPEYTILALPYLIRSAEHGMAFLKSEDGAALAGRVEEVTNGEIVSMEAYIASTPRHFFAKKPVTTMADMAGTKVRSETTDLKIDMMSAFGMSATPMPLNDMYSALQTGMIDGGEHNLSSIKSYAFYELCPHVLLTAHSYNTNVYLMSGKVWNSLSAEDQAIVKECMQKACDWCTEYYPTEDDAIMEELAPKGVTFTEPTDIDVWAEAASKLYPKYAAGYEDFIEVVQSYNVK